jgi:RNA polymerase sigma-70 factor (ECF subfamily)
MVGERSLAEDLLQDTFHDAFRARHLLAGIRSPEAWLFGIARHLALNALRRQRRFQRVVTRLTRGSTVSEGTDFELLALRDLLERHLEPEERALLFLRYLHGFDAAELGVMADRTPEAIRQRLARARAKLIAAADSAPDGRQRSQSSEEER